MLYYLLNYNILSTVQCIDGILQDLKQWQMIGTVDSAIPVNCLNRRAWIATAMHDGLQSTCIYRQGNHVGTGIFFYV